MKKKIALFMAGAMILSSLPTLGLFAGTSNKVGASFTNLQEDSLVVQKNDATYIGGSVVDNDLDISYVSRGTALELKVDAGDTIPEDTVFDLELSSNAEWFFAKDDAPTNSISKATNTGVAGSSMTETFDLFTGTPATGDPVVVTTAQDALPAVPAAITAITSGSVQDVVDLGDDA
ncbi:MAG: hypothetical protein LBU77_04675, partial [Clostridiales bacterium]|nr:hypothetical protein [Clostridiales bacterium]